MSTTEHSAANNKSAEQGAGAYWRPADGSPVRRALTFDVKDDNKNNQNEKSRDWNLKKEELPDLGNQPKGMNEKGIEPSS